MLTSPYEVHEPPELIERLRAIAAGIDSAIAGHDAPELNLRSVRALLLIRECRRTASVTVKVTATAAGTSPTTLSVRAAIRR